MKRSRYFGEICHVQLQRLKLALRFAFDRHTYQQDVLVEPRTRQKRFANKLDIFISDVAYLRCIGTRNEKNGKRHAVCVEEDEFCVKGGNVHNYVASTIFCGSKHEKVVGILEQRVFSTHRNKLRKHDFNVVLLV
jgi:hypothetical protein